MSNIDLLNKNIKFNGAKLKGDFVTIKTCPICNKRDKLGIRIDNGFVKCWVCGDELKGFLTKENLALLKKIVDLSNQKEEEKVLDIFTYDFSWVYKDFEEDINAVENVEEVLYSGSYYYPDIYNKGYLDFCNYIKDRGINQFNNNQALPLLRGSFIPMVQPFNEDENEVGLILHHENKIDAIYIYKTSNHQELKEQKKLRKHWMKGSVLHPFYFGDESAPNLVIFEGLEDCLAWVEIQQYTNKQFNIKDYCFCITFSANNFSKIKIGGDETKNYIFCLDNDEASMNAYKQIYNKEYDGLEDYVDYTITYQLPHETVKDFNDMLLNFEFKYEIKKEQKEYDIYDIIEKAENKETLTKNELKYYFETMDKMIDLYDYFIESSSEPDVFELNNIKFREENKIKFISRHSWSSEVFHQNCFANYPNFNDEDEEIN